jgi:histidine triad (HIT) family protein
MRSREPPALPGVPSGGIIGASSRFAIDPAPASSRWRIGARATGPRRIGARVDALGALHVTTVFERIIRGELAADVVYRDDRVTAFRDIRPRAPVHVLVVPNRPIPTANDVSEDTECLAGHMLVVAARVAAAEGIAESGYRLIINCNRDGGQEVYHLHLHLVGGAPLGPMLCRKGAGADARNPSSAGA